MTALVTSIRSLRMMTASWRLHDETVSFVPTMGALHDGHVALVQRAQTLGKRTVVSAFVNPLQFGPDDDASRYPRHPDDDLQKLQALGCDALFAPSLDEIFPEGFATRVHPGPIAASMEGAVAPGAFVGVATVMAKLLLVVSPDYVFFGEKDFQQLRVVEHLVRDLDFPVSVVAVPTVRDHDGLPLSGRNAALSVEDRKKASALPKVMQDVAERLRGGGVIDEALVAGRARMAEAGLIIDYLDLVDGRTLAPLTEPRKNARLCAAVRVGGVRLLDNLAPYVEG